MARVGGLVTGVTAVQSELPGKRLELIKELLPQARKVAVFSRACFITRSGPRPAA